MKPFSDKDPSEVITLGFDYTRILGVGETVTSATWYAEDSDGVAAANILSGSAVVATPIVKQIVIGGVVGTVYTHRSIAVTSAGRTLVLGNQQRIIAGGYSD